ncbi:MULTISPECIES: hypothetical protein [Methylorubrum]|uniref:hypothetical protein n=1 Tax=Methylorubrum TaxID=2282523 RepID=UPI00209F52A8|nr:MULTISPECIES: hypothetical protein [Methylorubrum]MCP1550684.1 hypothetical protein [Methylorubrum zatmanii]MCP1552703.1 hypothetical protein [Methylorubrum extorquens]MCP1580987.1 hypothetical protein [Methylorubrum extorquens]
MARIRTIKPEFWTSEQVMECSTNARLAFIGIWNFCDDAGRMPASAKQIKALVFPSDDFTSANVRGMIDELERNGLIRLYVVEEKEFLAVTGWHHQKIDRPQKPKTPEPPEHDPPPVRRTIGAGREGNTEGKGKDSRNGGGGDSHPARPTINRAPAEPPVAEAVAAAERSQGWATKDNFDRVERRCRAVLPAAWVNDLVVSPMARLEADGLDLEAEIIPTIIDLVAARRTPIRTWSILANAVAERVDVQRQARAAQGLSAKASAPPKPGEMVDLGAPFGSYGEAVLRVFIAKHRENGQWLDHMVGPPPGQPGCRIPARLLIGEAA